MSIYIYICMYTIHAHFELSKNTHTCILYIYIHIYETKRNAQNWFRPYNGGFPNLLATIVNSTPLVDCSYIYICMRRVKKKNIYIVVSSTTTTIHSYISVCYIYTYICTYTGCIRIKVSIIGINIYT